MFRMTLARSVRLITLLLFMFGAVPTAFAQDVPRDLSSLSDFPFKREQGMVTATAAVLLSEA